ncbi:MAG TPA: sigma-70 family RNA polymerase sigma factor [Verrucomicrobiae bacterium]|nr:sigma-70 family RNA polymerase sigma factor [Verrucomicrobiae bacterium]
MAAREEAELLRLCRVGDAFAWDELFDLHYDATARFVFQLGYDLSREDSEEICQEAFLAVIRNLNNFSGECRFQTWLFRIASNKARDFLERKRARKRGGGEATLSLNVADPETGVAIDPPSHRPGPEAALMQAEQAGLIHRALDRLEPPCREIIDLRYFADLSYEEISRALRLNPKTVSSRLSKCLARLEEIARQVFSGAKETLSPSNL